MSGYPSKRARAAIFLAVTLAAFPSLAHVHFDSFIEKRMSEPAEERPNDILLEDFEDAWLPAGWSRIISDPANTWDRTELKSHSEQYSASVHYGPQGIALDEWLVTPAMDFTDRSRVYLEFYEDQQYWSGFGSHHYIAISTTDPSDPAAFTILEDWTPENHSIPGFDGNPTFVDLSDYVGESQVYLAIRYYGEWADTWFIDDVRVYFPDQLDAAALEITPNQEQFEDGDTIVPRAVISNLGGEAFSIDVSMEVFESGTLIYSELLAISLEPAETDTLAFVSLDLNAGNYYKLEARTYLTDDEYPPNDLATSHVDTYTERRVPLGWLHTNAGSGPSLPADLILDETYNGHPGELSLVRLHTWWPGADIMYLANQEQSDSLLDEYGVDFVPHFWVDGTLDARFHVSTYEDLFLGARAIRSPLNLHMIWDADSQTAIVRINEVNPLNPTGDYRLRLAITEDGIEYDGGNGLEIHNQAFRAMVPSVEGLSFSTGLGFTEYEISCPMDPSWNLEGIRLCAFLQNMSDGKVWQSTSGLLSELKSQIFFSPPVSTVGISATVDVPIVLYPGFEDVKGVEVIVEFDPVVVELLEIVPGSWFTESEHAHYFYDYTADMPDPNGTVHFAGALLGGESNAPGVVAICRFTGLNLGSSALDFLEADIRGPLNEFLDFSTSLEDSIIVDDIYTTVDEASPTAARLLPNHPNPFNPWTRIDLALETPGNLRLEVFDPSGRRVRILFEGKLDAGSHEFNWNGRNERGKQLPSGVYLVRLLHGGGQESIKTVLLR
ncbi:choice-of-anchor J domain-containing protein [bacterium]|nr:choice-of-anchor J domain-containing protein [bacterium]